MVVCELCGSGSTVIFHTVSQELHCFLCACSCTVSIILMVRSRLGCTVVQSDLALLWFCLMCGKEIQMYTGNRT